MAILNMVIQQGLLGMYFFNGRSFIINCGNIFNLNIHDFADTTQRYF